MLTICNNRVVLRDFIESDIECRIRWETVETTYQLWDAPWEYEGLTEERLSKDLKNYIASMKRWVVKYAQMPNEQLRSGFQIEVNDETHKYIGWCNSYNIDKDFCFNDAGELTAIGIDIPEVSAWGKGYATVALSLFIEYLFTHGITDIYTQTWSGNYRMIGLAKKLGFVECCRKEGLRLVRGERYDGLTFKLDRESFVRFSEGL